jgi:hypothetical protein
MAIQTYYSAYQWYNASTGAGISGATGTSLTVSVTGDYYVEVTNSTGCSSNSAPASVTVLSVSIPTSLTTSAIQLDRATMNWATVANANHYDIRMRVQGTAWSVVYPLLLHMNGRFVRHVQMIVVQYLLGLLHRALLL